MPTPWRSALPVLVITFLTLVFGELVPKQLALRHPERLAAIVAQPLSILATVATPVVWLLGISTKFVLLLFGPPGDDRRAMSEEELKAMLVEGAETGVLETEERDIIERVLRLADKPVRAIMTAAHRNRLDRPYGVAQQHYCDAAQRAAFALCGM